MAVALRPVSMDDNDTFFEYMRDPESVLMAAFTPKDPDDRSAFDAWMANLASSPEVTRRAIIHEGRLVGSIASFISDGSTEITYWIGRAYWGLGIASEALAIFLDEVIVRPLRARAASDNLRSIRVLEKAGFQVVGTEVSFAAARGRAIQETIFELSAES